MIIHLFPKSQFTAAYVSFINNHFANDEHKFVLYTNVPFSIDEYVYQFNNVIDYDKKNILWLYNELNNAKKIILHNLSVNIYELFMLFICPRLVRKSIWVIWGGDLYYYRKKRNTIIEKAVEIFRKRVISNLQGIATLVDGDYDLVREWYNTNAISFRVQYVDEKNIELLTGCMIQATANREVVNIWVGNSATETNHHKEVFSLLHKYAGENIKIYVPLSYGSSTYADEIEALGKELFNEKFEAIRRFMDLKQYYRLLWQMDVAIFYNDRQQALGNITAFAFLEKKIYLRESTTMWDEWVIKHNYPFHSVESICNESLSEFLCFSSEEIDRQKIFANKYFDIEERIKEWEKVFNC